MENERFEFMQCKRTKSFHIEEYTNQRVALYCWLVAIELIKSWQ